jgi:hypothetical protein
VRELAGRHYQPLVARPGWSWKAALEWAHPAAAVVHAGHPAAQSGAFLSGVADLQIGVVMFGDAAPSARPSRAIIATDEARLIGSAVDDAVRDGSR